MAHSLFTSPVADERRAFLDAIDYGGPTMPHMDTPCWIYGKSSHHRARRVDWCRRKIPASHLAIILDGRDPDDGPIVRHICDNPECVRPDHLITGTYKDNSADWKARGTSPARRIMLAWHVSKGRDPYRPCPPDVERRLGKVADQLIAKDAGMPLHEVQRWRRERGIRMEPGHLRVPPR